MKKKANPLKRYGRSRSALGLGSLIYFNQRPDRLCFEMLVSSVSRYIPHAIIGTCPFVNIEDVYITLEIGTGITARLMSIRGIRT